MRSEPRNPKKETELCGPLREYLEARGYSVRSEVLGVDMVAERGEEVLVFELKRALSLALLAQAADRRRAFESVYIVIPHPGRRVRTGEWRSVCRLVKALELGMVLIQFSDDGTVPKVEIPFHPALFKRRTRTDVKRAVLSEARARSVDLNAGGSVGEKIVTAYRESAIQVACLLDAFGPLSPSALRKMGAADKTGSILLRNYYSWFTRMGHGLYALSDKGRQEMSSYPELVCRYAAELECRKDQ